MIRYISITGNAEPVNFKEALLTGIAADGGFYVPDQLPSINLEQLSSWKSLGYTDLAFEILSLFIEESIIPHKDLQRLIENSFASFNHPEIIPHTYLKDRNIIVQELFQGPTLSFKDVAMGLVVNLFDYFLRKDNKKMNIIVATSGDTGPAAGYASIGKSTLNTWLLYPRGMITEEQERQMTTNYAPNVHPIGVEGCRNGSNDFDVLIKQLFADEEFKSKTNLSSVNSLNWGRIMMQTVHYYYGYLQNVDRIGDLVDFAVPCGLIGNMAAGVIAREMGLPVDKFIVSTNENTVLNQAITEGIFSKQKEIHVNYSSAIDISVPSNFWRFLYFTTGRNTKRISNWFREYELNGIVEFPHEHVKSFSKGILTNSVTNEQTLETIRDVFEKDGYLLDPHAAVAVCSAKKKEHELGNKVICLATAHPSKFPDVTLKALGRIPREGTHQSMTNSSKLCQRSFRCSFDDMAHVVPKTILKLTGTE